MAIRSNHYEAAFEAYIRALRVPCVAVDEARRAIFGEDGVKNPDFLLYPRFSSNLVVEVKGKRGKNARGQRRGKTGLPPTIWTDWCAGSQCSAPVSGRSWPLSMPSRRGRFRCPRTAALSSFAGWSTASGR